MMGVLIITSLYVSKLVGGMLYMCIQMSKFIAWLLVRPHAQISAPAVLTVSSVCQQLVYGGFIAVMGGLFLFGQSGSSGEAAGANVRSIAYWYPGPQPGC